MEPAPTEDRDAAGARMGRLSFLWTPSSLSGLGVKTRIRGWSSATKPRDPAAETGNAEVIAASARAQQYAGPLILPSYNGYETMRARFNFDITCLTSFTSIDLTASASSLLQHNPECAGSLLQRWSSCFLSYLPSRYDSRPFLDDAMHCVAARAAYMVGSSTSPLLHTALYSRALANVAAAIQADDPSLLSDIYCATRLLVLYEASLFETQEWQDFFDRAASEETDADSQLSWRFIGAVSFIAGILKDIQSLFENTPMCQPEYTTQSTDILERTGRIYRAFHTSHLFYQQRPPYLPSLFDLPVAAEPPGRTWVRGIFFHAIIFLCRIQATFGPTEDSRAASEAEAQALATQALLATGTAQARDPVLAWQLEERSDLNEPDCAMRKAVVFESHLETLLHRATPTLLGSSTSVSVDNINANIALD
ncbi:hypothetical protein PG994_003561 [Apiospora phragmitis]|uniref:Uncharacterized protein n=1 Tax=Apiospora phragmitis TaxID=2905665 RepID=A0ABR1VYI5_9PEZI